MWNGFIGATLKQQRCHTRLEFVQCDVPGDEPVALEL
jgi:hypothetical protein